MNEELILKLGIANVPEEVQDATLQSVALGVEVRTHEQAAEILDDSQMSKLQEKSQKSPEVVFAWLQVQSPKLAKLYQTELQAYLEEKAGPIA